MTGKISILLAGAVVALAVANACAAPQQRGAGGMAGQLAERVPARQAPPPGTRVERDVTYGVDPAQRLDVYRPEKAANAPILVMVHGGGWTRGDKANPGVVDNKVAHWIPKGAILVSVNYRLVPKADVPTQANDVARAVAFVQAHARDWGGDPARVVLMGHSAGAHLVALLAAAPDIARSTGVRSWLGTIALDSAAYDVVALMERRHLGLYDEALGSDRQIWRAISPTLRLESAPAPLLLVCSTKRADSCPPTEEFAAKARALHGRATVVPVDLTHAEINHLVGTKGGYTDAIDAFLTSIGLN